MGDIVDFPKKLSKHMVSLYVYEDTDGKLEVTVEVQEGYGNDEIFQALICATAKFAIDTDCVEDDDDGIDPL